MQFKKEGKEESELRNSLGWQSGSGVKARAYQTSRQKPSTTKQKKEEYP
jgi:hypothetical protein